MADDIKIGVASDTKAFEQGVSRGVLKPLENVEDALDALDRAGAKSGLEDGMKDAQRATERFQKEIDQTADKLDAMGRANKYSAKSVADDIDTTSTRGKENLKELGEEGRANLAETLSSFDGSVEGFVSGIQGTLGGVVSGLSGVGGILVAAAGAAGVGLLMSQMQKSSEEAQALREKVADLAGEFIETGGVADASLDYMIDKIKELALQTDEGATSLKDLARDADRSGSSFKDLAQVYAGNTDGIKEMVRAGKERLAQLEDEAEAIDTTNAANNGKYKSLELATAAQQRYNAYLDEADKLARKAAETESFYARSGAAEMAAKAEVIKSVDAAYDDAAGAVTDYINEETGIFDTAGYIDSMNARAQALRDYQQTLAESPLSSEAKTFLSEQGQESAAQFLAGYKAATPAQQAELNRIWTESGRTSSGAYTTTVNSQLGGAFSGTRIPGPTIVPSVDERSVQSRFDAIGRRTITVPVIMQDKFGRKIDG